MTIFKKCKPTVICQSLFGFFIVSCFLISLFQSQNAYAEMKKVTGTSKVVSTLLDFETSRFQEDVRVQYTNRLNEWSSADPTWNKGKVFTVYFFINPTRLGDDFMGSLAFTDPNGDQAFVQYVGSWKYDSPSTDLHWNAEEKGTFIGGTGKFKGVKGSYKAKTKGTGAKRSIEWEINYEIVSPDN